MIGFIVHKQSTTATVRENRSSYSLTDDGRNESRNNLNDCLSVKLCVEFYFSFRMLNGWLVVSVKILLAFVVCILLIFKYKILWLKMLLMKKVLK